MRTRYCTGQAKGTAGKGRGKPQEGGHHAQRIECQARAAVRAHQGQRQAARRVREARRGDRRAHGEQGAGALG
ncbi:hypothetical protein SBRY_40278 [Actinacidiphila bryophytorum]|uniref:Uncharacterized protein n=1 Tax=Actinacidiphila bryophytorum TaxID=1436133 RepID=A0A9W4MCS9_9ACTN|nr:hypothetical protein SBRY_40278 [Actinacidiphila bryophytorum]